MTKILLTTCCLLWLNGLSAQTVTQKLQKAFSAFEKDVQLKHAISSLYVIDAETGQVVFDKNAQIGLAPASTQKVITSVTAFELLGKDYRYKTTIAGDETRIVVGGSYDPTFGSWRYAGTTQDKIFDVMVQQLRAKGINQIAQVIVYTKAADLPPSAWINQDIGNYYGAAAQLFNWNENQYDLTFIPGKETGDFTSLDTSRNSYRWNILNGCKTGPPGSGDNAYIYFVPGTSYRSVEGTIPGGVKRFTISGADPLPGQTFSLAFQQYLSSKGLFTGDKDIPVRVSPGMAEPILKNKYLFSLSSPSIDSIIYWFNKKSINLYGEALIKTFAYEKQGVGSTDSGVAILKKFWKEKGFDEDELNMFDGSGLSPQNRVTTHAQVEILKYAKSRDWYPYFYNSLPDYNGMKMKSGTIRDVKGFCGYHKAGNGKEYIFAFLVNNYSGKSSPLVAKMYKVLDELK